MDKKWKARELIDYYKYWLVEVDGKETLKSTRVLSNDTAAFIECNTTGQ